MFTWTWCSYSVAYIMAWQFKSDNNKKMKKIRLDPVSSFIFFTVNCLYGELSYRKILEPTFWITKLNFRFCSQSGSSETFLARIAPKTFDHNERAKRTHILLTVPFRLPRRNQTALISLIKIEIKCYSHFRTS